MSEMPELPDLNPDDDHTPESLEKTLHQYAAAIRSEFETSYSDTDPKENAERFSEDFAKENLPNNLAQIQWLASNSTSDGVRANCAKYLVELARKDATKDGDPIKELMSKFIKTPSGNQLQ